ncbi:pilus assembly PilX family protein [Immundisolibacter sp.]
MHTQHLAAPARQRGVSTLVVAIVLLIAATFLTFFAAKVGMQEQRMAGNDTRQKAAFATAEALMDRGKTFLEANATNFQNWPWTACSSVNMPCGDGSTAVFDGTWSWVSVRALTTVDGTGDSGAAALGILNGEAYILTTTPGDNAQPVVLVGEGRSDDNTGYAVVRQAQKRVFTVQPGPIPPLTAPAVGLSGSFHLVGNPNHAMTKEELLQITPANCDNFNSGSGQLLSIWTKQNFNALAHGVGSWDICQAQFFKTQNAEPLGQYSNCFLGTTTAGCGCQSAQDPMLSVCRSQNFGNSSDPNKLTLCGIKDNDNTFPNDLFGWIFGASPAEVKATADQVLPNCNTLSAASTGLIWVTGDCNPPGDVGSRFDPVVLVVDGEVTFGANSQVWGLAVANESPKVKLNGGFTLHGAMAVVDEVNPPTNFQANGTYNAIYDPCVFAAIYNNDEFVEYAPIEGSWSDSLR